MATRLLPGRKVVLKPWIQFTELEKRFVELYMTNGYNPSDAYDGAGYSKKIGRNGRRANAWKVLRRDHIQAEIERRMKVVQMTENEALARHSAVGRGDVGDCLVDDPHYCPHCKEEIADFGLRLDLKLLKENGLTHLIKKLTPFKDGRIAIELYESDKARQDILKAHGTFRSQFEEQATGFVALAAAARGGSDRTPLGDTGPGLVLSECAGRRPLVTRGGPTPGHSEVRPHVRALRTQGIQEPRPGGTRDLVGYNPRQRPRADYERHLWPGGEDHLA
jgi:hypothetical protein